MGRVTDVFKKQPVRWRRGRDRMIARRGEQLGKRFQSAATCRDVNHGPHEEPNHVVEEPIRLDSEVQPTAVAIP